MALEVLGVSAHPSAPAESWLPLSLCRDETSLPIPVLLAPRGCQLWNWPPVPCIYSLMSSEQLSPTAALGVAGGGCHVLPWGTHRATV